MCFVVVRRWTGDCGCVPLRLPILMSVVESSREVCRRNKSYLHVRDHLFTKRERLAHSSYVFSRSVWERTIVALGLLAQPGEEGLAVESKSISRRSTVECFRNARNRTSHARNYSKVSIRCCLWGVTKLRAFVEAGRSHVGTRDQRRGGSRGITHLSRHFCWSVWSGG